MSALRPSCFSCRSLPCRVCPLYWSKGELRLTLSPAGDLVGNKEAVLCWRGLPLFLLKKMQRGELSGEGAKAATLSSHLPVKQRQTFCAYVCWDSRLELGGCWNWEGLLSSSHHCLLSHADIKIKQCPGTWVQIIQKNSPRVSVWHVPFSMLSAAPQVSERSTGQSSKLRNSNRASSLTLDGFDSTVFRFVFLVYFESGSKKGGVGSGGKSHFELPPSTFTCCTTVTFPMMPASKLRQGPPRLGRSPSRPLMSPPSRAPRSKTADFVSRGVEDSFELQTDSEGEVVAGINVNYYYLHV